MIKKFYTALLILFLFSSSTFAAKNTEKINPEKRIKELKIVLPVVSSPLAKYNSYTRSGNKIYISGQLPINSNKLMFKGKLGDDISDLKAIEATKLAALNVIAQIKSATGSLRKVKKITRITGYFNTTADYAAHYKIMDAASDLFVDIFGKSKGNHARVAIGVNSLPFDSPVVLEAHIEL